MILFLPTIWMIVVLLLLLILIRFVSIASVSIATSTPMIIILVSYRIISFHSMIRIMINIDTDTDTFRVLRFCFVDPSNSRPSMFPLLLIRPMSVDSVSIESFTPLLVLRTDWGVLASNDLSNSSPSMFPSLLRSKSPISWILIQHVIDSGGLCVHPLLLPQVHLGSVTWWWWYYSVPVSYAGPSVDISCSSSSPIVYSHPDTDNTNMFHVHQLYLYCNNNCYQSYRLRLATYILNVGGTDSGAVADAMFFKWGGMCCCFCYFIDTPTVLYFHYVYWYFFFNVRRSNSSLLDSIQVTSYYGFISFCFCWR